MTGSLRKRGPDNWQLRVYLGVDADTGKQRWATTTVRGSKRYANTLLAEFARQAEYSKVRAGTVNDLLDRWVSAAAPKWAPSTRRENLSIIGHHLKPHLGHLPVGKLTTADIDDLYAYLVHGGGRTSADRAIRFVSPVSVYRPGDATPSPVPDDYVAYLLGLEADGAILTDITETTVGGCPATLITANTPESIDGALGCQADALTAADCFGPQPELTLRIAVIQLDPAPLLIWLRDIRRPDGKNLETGTFDAMLASLEFRDP